MRQCLVCSANLPENVGEITHHLRLHTPRELVLAAMTNARDGDTAHGVIRQLIPVSAR